MYRYNPFDSSFRSDAVNADTGKFFNVSGSAPAKVEFKPGLLMTQNPYYFEGETLDKTKDRYVLHNGFITDCKPEDMWWKLKAKSFDIVPGQRAIAHNLRRAWIATLAAAGDSTK